MVANLTGLLLAQTDCRWFSQRDRRVATWHLSAAGGMRAWIAPKLGKRAGGAPVQNNEPYGRRGVLSRCYKRP